MIAPGPSIGINIELKEIRIPIGGPFSSILPIQNVLASSDKNEFICIKNPNTMKPAKIRGTLGHVPRRPRLISKILIVYAAFNEFGGRSGVLRDLYLIS